MIISFRHKGLRYFYETGNTRGIQTAHAKRLKRLKRQLQFLDRAIIAQDVNLPGVGSDVEWGDSRDYH